MEVISYPIFSKFILPSEDGKFQRRLPFPLRLVLFLPSLARFCCLAIFPTALFPSLIK